MRFNTGNLRFRLIALVLLAIVPLAGLMFYTAYEQRKLEIADIEGDVLASQNSPLVRKRSCSTAPASF